MLSWEFINVLKAGSNHVVSLTDEGSDALRFLKIYRRSYLEDKKKIVDSRLEYSFVIMILNIFYKLTYINCVLQQEWNIPLFILK
jgi:hypothetical protein